MRLLLLCASAGLVGLAQCAVTFRLAQLDPPKPRSALEPNALVIRDRLRALSLSQIGLYAQVEQLPMPAGMAQMQLEQPRPPPSAPQKQTTQNATQQSSPPSSQQQTSPPPPPSMQQQLPYYMSTSTKTTTFNGISKTTTTTITRPANASLSANQLPIPPTLQLPPQPKLQLPPQPKLQMPAQPGQLQPQSLPAMPQLLNQRDVMNHTSRAAATSPAVNLISSYALDVVIGTPGTLHRLVLDTGSAMTVLDPQRRDFRTNSSRHRPESFATQYGSAFASGPVYEDKLTLGPLVAEDTPLGIGTTFNGLPDGVEGILGLGGRSLMQGSLFPNVTQTLPTVTERLFDSGATKDMVVGISLARTGGKITFGSIDHASIRDQSEITYTNLVSEGKAARHFAVEATVRANGKVLGSGPCLIDTGSTLFMGSDQFMARYLETIEASGARLDPGTGLINFAKLNDMPDLQIDLGSATLVLAPKEQVFSREEMAALGLESASNASLGIVSSLGPLKDAGFEFVLGLKVLQQYYTVFDSTNRRVGWAETTQTIGGIRQRDRSVSVKLATFNEAVMFGSSSRSRISLAFILAGLVFTSM
ncbi:uncharacterized protein L969DRAFT_89752 [Mixia osmundae IAM 14324]|uniref:uncharacterized protein n=1 Tax=Mixia osmundae (strain CBS 9802 / IAM 14324 / JCM 22182 / KY 12970) TaxID=764103 RepID=UPI0004A55264|nr:uncharacterized protein L969DRAFT_89752 [Mixia osmundae IAM 14324]KEI37778.1 hypothetical protein L969DRAFT_89752 [Mixia osmundae IAM 14324]